MSDHAWRYDLVNPDDEVRGRALESHRALIDEYRVTIGGAGPLSAFLGEQPYGTPRLVPDAEVPALSLLFLRWEACHPQEWREHNSRYYSPWSGKESVLRGFARGGVPDELRSEAADLLLAAVLRPYRCKDWMYARLVHHVPTTAFRDRVDDPDPLVSARARFLLHVADHPGGPLNRTTWQRWVDGLAVRTDVR